MLVRQARPISNETPILCDVEHCRENPLSDQCQPGRFQPQTQRFGASLTEARPCNPERGITGSCFKLRGKGATGATSCRFSKAAKTSHRISPTGRWPSNRLLTQNCVAIRALPTWTKRASRTSYLGASSNSIRHRGASPSYVGFTWQTSGQICSTRT